MCVLTLAIIHKAHWQRSICEQPLREMRRQHPLAGFIHRGLMEGHQEVADHEPLELAHASNQLLCGKPWVGHLLDLRIDGLMVNHYSEQLRLKGILSCGK